MDGNNPSCNCSHLQSDQGTTSQCLLSVISDMKVAKQAITITLHAHGRNPDTVLESFASNLDGFEGRTDHLLGCTIFRVNNSGAYPEKLANLCYCPVHRLSVGCRLGWLWRLLYRRIISVHRVIVGIITNKKST